jgi:hypothetical protein
MNKMYKLNKYWKIIYVDRQENIVLVLWINKRNVYFVKLIIWLLRFWNISGILGGIVI